MLRTLGACLILAVLAMPGAYAEDADEGRVSFRGFASVGLARTDRSDYGVVSNYAQRRPVFNVWSPNLDTVVGGQFGLRFGLSDSVVVQALARAGEDWSPRATLGFWEHRFLPGLSVRAGRIASPLFRDSDIINVGYANLLVRPSLPIYAKVHAMPSVDGIDASWQGSFGDVSLGVQVYGGNVGYTHRVHPDGVSHIEVRGGGMRGLAVSARSGELSVRLSHSVIHHFTLRSPEVDALGDAVGQLVTGLRGVPGLSAQADALAAYRNPMESQASYSSIGFDWSPRNWRVMAEWTQYEPQSSGIAAGDAWHLIVGRTFDRVTPYAFVAAQSSRLRALDGAAFAATGVPSLDAALAQVKGGLEYFRNSSDLSMRSRGVGMRFDFAENMALKVQYERLHSNYAMAASKSSAWAASPPSLNITSIVLDVVF